MHKFRTSNFKSSKLRGANSTNLELISTNHRELVSFTGHCYLDYIPDDPVSSLAPQPTPVST